MKVYKQFYDSYGDILFLNYFTTKQGAINFRKGKRVSPPENCKRWEIEEIEVKE